MLKFFHKMVAANEQILGMNRRNVEFVKKLNKRRDFPLADDKILSKAFFEKIGAPTAPVLRVFESLFEIKDFYEKFDQNEFVIKPSCGSQGKGIIIISEKVDGGYRKISGNLMSRDEIQYEMASILFGKYSIGRSDRILIEKRLSPAQEFAQISVQGLFDIRVIVVCGTPIGAMLRLPTIQSGGKANLHQGGIGVGINILSGTTTSAFHLGRSIQHHPDTKAELIGFNIPFWNDISSIAQLIGSKSPLKYIGVDLTIDKDSGPSVLEFNARPGLGIQNANQLGFHQVARRALICEAS